MARKAKDILLARGYTEADLTAMATLLADPKFTNAIEAEAAQADTLAEETVRLKKDLDDDAAWYRDTAQPALAKATSEAVKARSDAAALEARLKAMQDYGLAKVAETQTTGSAQTPANPQGNGATSTPSEPDSRYVAANVFQNTVAQFGGAIAMAQDIADDHRELFGSRIPGGVTKLREEYQSAVNDRRYHGSMRQFWEDKFKVPDKRTELAAATKQKEIDDAVTTAHTKWVSEQANPMTRTLTSSRNPFTNRATPPVSSSTGTPANVSNKQPWEKGTNERSGARVSKFAVQVLNKAS